MSTALKCPNPSCPYLFDPSRVPAGVVLTCPRCGMRFTLGAPQPAAAPTQAAFENSPPADPSAFGGMSNEPEVSPDGKPIRRSFSAAGEASTLQLVIIAFICFVLLAGVATVIYFKLTSKPSSGGGEKVDKQLRQHNLSFEIPGSPWAIDPNTRAALGPPIILAFKRTEPDAFIGIGAKDFGSRPPRSSEMKDALTQLLDRNFTDVKRYPIADATFLGQPAVEAFKFEGGSRHGPTMVGVCYSTHFKGIGYWYIAWASEKDVAGQADTFEAIRERLKLEKYRDSWMPRETPINPFGGRTLGYQVLDGEDLWEEPDPDKRPATGEDPKGDLLLQTKKQPGKDFSEEATLLAMILPSDGGDPLAQGRRYVEKRIADAVKAADPTLVPMYIERTSNPDGEPPSNDSIETPAPVVRLQVTVPGASTFAKLVVVSAIKIGDKVVVVEAWCAWKDHEFFEAKFKQIAGSLHENK